MFLKLFFANLRPELCLRIEFLGSFKSPPPPEQTSPPVPPLQSQRPDSDEKSPVSMGESLGFGKVGLVCKD